MIKTTFKKIRRLVAAFLLYYSGFLNLCFHKEKNKYHNCFIRVVNYHNVKENEQKRLNKQLLLLKKRFEIISYNYFKFLVTNKISNTKHKPYLLLTFDDGLEGNYTYLFPILKKLNVSALFFVCPSLIGNEGYMSSLEIKECLDSGLVTIGSHTSTHKKLDHHLSDNETEYEVFQSKEKLEKMFNTEIDAFCFPFGDNDSYSVKAFYYVIKSKYSYYFCTFSNPIVTGSNITLIPRTNLQINWKKSEIVFQLSNFYDKRLKKRYLIIENNYSQALNRYENNRK